MKAQYTGYSNGKKYLVYKVKDETTGLCDIEGMTHPVWCTFEKIEKNK